MVFTIKAATSKNSSKPRPLFQKVIVHKLVPGDQAGGSASNLCYSCALFTDRTVESTTYTISRRLKTKEKWAWMHRQGCHLRHCDGRQLLVGAFHSLHSPSVSETSVDCHVGLRNNEAYEVIEKKVQLDTAHRRRRKAKGVEYSLSCFSDTI
jgi:hypothetical protein